MIGIDTNILVRYIIRDHPGQSKKATDLLESCTEKEPGFINAIVLAEFIWVLEKRYKYSREQIFSMLEILLSTRELKFEHANAAWHATYTYLKTKAGFVDLFLGRINNYYGCGSTMTFDRNAAQTSDYDIV